jgi:hypothetical protein
VYCGMPGGVVHDVDLTPRILGHFFCGTFEGQYIHGRGLLEHLLWGLICIGLHIAWACFHVSFVGLNLDLGGGTTPGSPAHQLLT